MKKLILFFLLFMSTYQVNAQLFTVEGRQVMGNILGTVSATDINPAFLGISDEPKFSLNLLEIGYGAYSEGLPRNYVQDLIFSDAQFNQTVVSELITGLVGDNGFNLNANVNWVAGGYAHPKFGGFGLKIRDRASAHIAVNNDLIDLLLLGADATVFDNVNPDSLSVLANIGNGTDLFAEHVREIQLAYGLRIVNQEKFKVSAGLTYKMMWGIGHFNFKIEEGTASLKSSISDFYSINYGELTPSFASLEQNFFDRKALSTGLNLGLGIELGKALTIGVSVVDLGKITWKENVVTASADFLAIADSLQSGIGSFEIQEEVDFIYDLIDYQEGGEFETSLPTKLRFQGVFRVGEILSVNADIIYPFQRELTAYNVYQPADYGFGGSARLPFLTVNGGVYYNEIYGMRVPLGVSIGLGKAALFSVSTGDLLTWTSNEKSPYSAFTVSLISIGGK